jgi:hypothetical protein
MAQTPKLPIWKAIAIGQLVVNLPSVGIMFAALFLGSVVALWQPLSLLAGALAAWVWWSVTVSRWRDWALDRGIDPVRLQKFAFRTGLTWPKGSLFERTEFHRKK